ncbi:hypothetical protein KKD61_00955 [Patescibacteria group bacterium]|nr:hypothetical protein [Patescibacteria group bacterium]
MEFGEITTFAQSLDGSRKSVDRIYTFLLDKFELERPEERDFQRNGALITFDGHSGAGKDTQIALLKKHMQETVMYQGRRIVELVQKRSDPFRQVPKYLWAHPEIQSGTDCSQLLLTAGRRYFAYNTLLPLLEDPVAIVILNVILNRSYLSHIAYHASNTDELPDLIALSDFDPNSDLAFVLECDVNIAYSRVISRSAQKGGIIYKNERPDYIERVRRNFRGLAALVNRLVFVDTSNEPELVTQEISQKADTYFQQRK